MKKLLGLSLVLILGLYGAAANALEGIDKAIKESFVNKSAVSISVRNLKNGSEIYHLNSRRPLNPASTQKLVTYAAALNTLGKDYVFSTDLYKSINNDLFLKLSGDPYLSTKDLKKLFSTAKSKNILEPKHVYIDDSVLDSNTWGEGWQWDDELSPLMPKYGAYNLDSNLIKVSIKPTTLNSPADIYPEVFYPIGFVNLVTTGKENKISLKHNETISPNLLEAKGTVKDLTFITIPVKNLKLYFTLRLEEAINDSKVLYYGKIYGKQLPKEKIYLVDKIEHPLSDASLSILRSSNNMIAETVFKLAGGKYSNSTGTIQSALEMLNEFCKENNINMSDIKIVDGSGVSKNNLMTAEFMTNFLVAESKQKDFETYKEAMASPGMGTLSNRMLYLQESLKAKTGTLSDVSAMAGYIKTRKGNEYAFDIMINDPKSSSSDKKIMEEMVLRTIYTEY